MIDNGGRSVAPPVRLIDGYAAMKPNTRQISRRFIFAVTTLCLLMAVVVIACWATSPPDGSRTIFGPTPFHSIHLFSYSLSESSHGFELLVLHYSRSPHGPQIVYNLPGIDWIVNPSGLHGPATSFILLISFPLLLVLPVLWCAGSFLFLRARMGGNPSLPGTPKLAV